MALESSRFIYIYRMLVTLSDLDFDINMQHMYSVLDSAARFDIQMKGAKLGHYIGW